MYIALLLGLSGDDHHDDNGGDDDDGDGDGDEGGDVDDRVAATYLSTFFRFE